MAAPLSTIDLGTPDGKHINIEERDEDEVLKYSGLSASGRVEEFRMANPTSHAMNPAFDVTPAELIAGIITQKGIVKPNELKKLF